MTDIMWGFGVFFAACALDVAWAKYTYAVTARHPTRAASYAVLLYLLSGYAIIEYTANAWMLLPACAGSFCGTYFVVRWWSEGAGH